ALSPTTRAVLVSHLHGGLVSMREGMAWARAQGLPVGEDAAQAPGARVQGRKAGTWGDVGLLSCGGCKLLSAGRGRSRLTQPDEDARPAYYKLGFQYDGDRFGLSRQRFVAALRAEGLAFDEGFAALHVGRSPRRLRLVGDLRNATQAHTNTVILHHPILLGTA